MKICLINNLYKPYNRGGAERIMELQAGGLVQAGHEIFIITTKPFFAQCETPKNPRIYHLNGLYYNLKKIPKILRLPWHIFDMFDIVNYLKVKSILKKENPNIVITHNLKGLSYLIPAAIKKTGAKHIHLIHDAQLLHPSGLILFHKEKALENILTKTYATINRHLFSSPTIVISPSNWLMKLHTNKKFFKNSEKIILPNPSPTLNDEKKENKDKKKFRFLYVGQLEKHKGILFLIKTFSILCDNFGHCRFELIIVGSGSKAKKAKQLAKNNKNIILVGKKQPEEIEKLMKKSDCLIIPSLCYENSPTVIYEAAAAGLPIIASRLGGMTELMHKLDEILFKAGNEGDLMHQMKWAINNRQTLEKIGKNSQQKIKKFALERYIKKLISTF